MKFYRRLKKIFGLVQIVDEVSNIKTHTVILKPDRAYWNLDFTRFVQKLTTEAFQSERKGCGSKTNRVAIPGRCE